MTDRPIPAILDTDIGSDIDDTRARAMLDAPGPVTLIGIGPATTIAATGDREPGVAVCLGWARDLLVMADLVVPREGVIASVVT